MLSPTLQLIYQKTSLQRNLPLVSRTCCFSKRHVSKLLYKEESLHLNRKSNKTNATTKYTNFINPTIHHISKRRILTETSSTSLIRDEGIDEISLEKFVEKKHRFKFMNEEQLEHQVQYLENNDFKQTWDAPFINSIHILMENCARLKSVRGAKLTERILAWCIFESSSELNMENRPIDLHDNENGNDDNLELDQWNAFADTIHDSENIFPTPEMYNIAIDAWGKSKSKGNLGAKRAEQILNLMIDEYIQNYIQRRHAFLQFHKLNTNDGSKNDHSNSYNTPPLPKQVAKPDAVNFSAVMTAWGLTGDKNAAKQAHRVFQRMQSLHTNEKQIAASRANKTLNLSVQPDTICFNTLMSIWSHSDHKEMIHIVESLFSELSSLHNKTQNPSLHPNNKTYSTIIDAYARYLSSLHSPKPEDKTKAVRRAESLFQEMQQIYKINPNSPLRPDTITYNSFLNVLSHSGNPKRAELFLDKMIAMQAEAYASDNHDLIVKPNTTTYNTIINGWANLASEESGVQAEHIMKRISDDDGGVQPNVITYNSVINAHAKSQVPDAAERAQSILERMIESNVSKNELASQNQITPYIQQNFNEIIPRPNIVTFGTVIHAWSRSTNPKAPHHALALLQQMQNLDQIGNFRNIIPNKECFQAVIIAFRNINNAEKAEEVLFQLHNQSTKSRNIQKPTKPNTNLYNIVLSAWINDKSNTSQKCKRAYDLLQWMEQLYQETRDVSVRPNIDSFNIVIEVCGSLDSNTGIDLNDDIIDDNTKFNKDDTVNARKQAFFIAIEAFNALCDRTIEYLQQRDNLKFKGEKQSTIRHKPHSISPNSDTYILMLKMIRNILPAHSFARSKLGQKLFLECCRDGLVNNNVLLEFKNAVTTDEFLSCTNKIRGIQFQQNQRNLDAEDLDVNDLPFACYSNSLKNKRS